MKKIFTLIGAALMATAGFAKDYTDQLVVTVNGVSTTQKATISLEQNASGTYDFSLKNFILDAGGTTIPVGTITLNGCVGTTVNGVTTLNVDRDINIAAGDAAGVAMWLGPMLPTIPVRMVAEQRDNSLYTVIDIDLSQTSLGQTIKVTFGGGYQFKNSGFEDYRTDSIQQMDDNYNMVNIPVQEPLYWHSFASAGGDYAAAANLFSAPHTQSSDIVRPGSTGKKSLLLTSSLALGTIVANGTITTGRMNAGDGMNPASTLNNAWLDMDSTTLDSHGDPFYTVMNGRPDSLSVWVKFIQGTPSTEYPYATVSAAITDGTYYQDPQDKPYNNVLSKAKNDRIESNGGEWQHIVIPFEFVDSSVNSRAILTTISTNPVASQAGLDSLYVDDISLIYNPAKATAISIKGDNVENLKAGQTVTLDKSYSNLSADDIIVTTDNKNTKVYKTLRTEMDEPADTFVTDTVAADARAFKAKEQNGSNVIVTIKVSSNDLQNINTYTFVIPNSTTGVRAINVEDTKAETAPVEIYNLNGQRVNGMQPGHVYVVKKGGKAVKVLR